MTGLVFSMNNVMCQITCLVNYQKQFQKCLKSAYLSQIKGRSGHVMVKYASMSFSLYHIDAIFKAMHTDLKTEDKVIKIIKLSKEDCS